jgi:N-methylhydantoinase B
MAQGSSRTTSADDAITAEVVRHALAVAAEEASVVVVRASHSTWIQEGADAAAALLDVRGQLVAQSAATSLMHAASLRCGLLAVLADLPADRMRPGDVYATNDPYRGGIHANDIMVFVPVFADGRAAYVGATVIHVADVGGSAAGGLAALATDTFAEGIVLPTVHLYREGVRQDDVFGILERNSRLPDKTRGDVDALIAGATTVARRVDELLARYGAGPLAELIEAHLARSERQVRDGLAQLPRGTTHGRASVDTDGIDPDRDFDVVVAVTIDDDGAILDFTGTSVQARGPVNASYSQALSGVVYAMRCLVDPAIPMDEGSFRPLRVILPQGSLLNPDPPAACGGRVVSVTAAVDAVLDAVGGLLPEQVVAPSSLIQVFTLAGAGAGWVHMSYEFGGIGARRGGDGPDATGAYFLGGRSVIPQIEPVEAQLPVVVDSVRLAPDSGGPGRWRGGLGVEMRVRVLEPTSLTVRGDRIIEPPPGRDGGEAGRPGRFAVERADGTVDALATRQAGVHLDAGDVFVLATSGGGGVGPANERDRAAVARDVVDGRVSTAGSAADYAAEVGE